MKKTSLIHPILFEWNHRRSIIAEQILSLPVGPHLTKEQAGYVCETANAFFKQ